MWKRLIRQLPARAGVYLAALAILCAPAFAAGIHPETLVPMGNAVGIHVQIRGAVVAGLVDIETGDGTVCPAKDAGLVPGDIIVQLGGREITSGADVETALENTQDEEIQIIVRRNEKELQMTIKLYRDVTGACELGVELRDMMIGIGTMTFFDPETGVFGALGHQISDIDSGCLIPIKEGIVTKATITGVVPGVPGLPGQLQGAFDLRKTDGTVLTNTPGGIFGFLEKKDGATLSALPVADENEICLGDAVILSNVNGDEVKEYAIEITRIYTGEGESGRNMMITIKDEALLSVTNGIVQGMSGSPILQNGKIIGAVTHVLVNTPNKGYGISIGNMLGNIDLETRDLAA